MRSLNLGSVMVVAPLISSAVGLNRSAVVAAENTREPVTRVRLGRGKDAGSTWRIADVLVSFDVTWVLYSLTAPGLLRL